MAKTVDDSGLDAGLNTLKSADRMIICEGEPMNYTQAVTLKSAGGKRLAAKAIASSSFTGPADGDVSGRKLTKNTESIVGEEAGSADHVALVDDGTSTLQQVTTISGGPVSISPGASYNIGPFKREIGDPT